MGASGLRIGIVAGEASGDILGAGLIRVLNRRFENIEFEGIAGDLMIAEGCHSRVPLERLSVMGLVEVLGRLPELIRLRRSLRDDFIRNKPDLFIGIDAPDFNLDLEGALKQAGVPTVHYVSPSVWAWKQKRIYKIRRTTDLVLSLFPFEADYYKPTGQSVAYVGHPLADLLPHSIDQNQAKSSLVQNEERPVVAILPGSRGSEIKYLARPFLDAARLIQQQKPDAFFLLPAANEKRLDQLRDIVAAEYSELNLKIVLKQSREVMAAADAILIASGTATLEAALMETPMVVAYKMSPVTYAIYSRMLKTKYVSLPNILAGTELVPEMLQSQAEPELLAQQVIKMLDDKVYRDAMAEGLARIGEELRCDASERAADAIVELLKNRGVI